MTDDTPNPSDNENFAVDLQSMVDLLANHLYSGPQVFLRELLQNATDAIVARQLVDPANVGQISIELDSSEGRPQLSVTDNGIGLSPHEARTFLSVIGRSAKRDEIGLSRLDFIGQFGVGLLSCFAVSDRIEVTSRSLDRSEQPVRWVGESSGTWSAEIIDPDDQPVGTTVTLTARRGDEHWFDPKTVAHHLRYYGELLPSRIMLSVAGQTGPAQLVNRIDVPLRRDLTEPGPGERAELASFGADLLGFEPLDALPLSAPVGQARGVAYVLPFAPAPSAARADRVYVKGMLVSDATDRLLPPWAFFVRCVVEADAVNPTASREDLHDDDVLAMARDELGQSLTAQLIRLADSEPERLQALIEVHHLSLKALAVVDSTFLGLVADWLPVETTDGFVAFGEFRRRHPNAYVTRTVDEFRQVAPIAVAQGLGVVCGGYTHDAAFVARAADTFADFAVAPVELADLFDGFERLSTSDEALAAPLAEVAAAALDPYGVEVLVRRFHPRSTPALFSVGEVGRRLRSLQRTQDFSNDLFGSILANLEADFDNTVDHDRPALCLNMGNPLVERLVAIDDPLRARRAVEVLYVQALLLGRQPLRPAELGLLNNSLIGMLDLSLGGGRAHGEDR